MAIMVIQISYRYHYNISMTQNMYGYVYDFYDVAKAEYQYGNYDGPHGVILKPHRHQLMSNILYIT